MAVLLSGWGAAHVYQDALERVGASTYIIRMEGFYDRQEVADLLVALQAVFQPLDDRALFGYLRGPFVALKDESLLGIALSIGRTPYWRRLECGEGLDLLAAEERERAERGLRILRHAIAMRDRIPVDRLLQQLLEETGYTGHLALMGNDKIQAVANVRKLVRIARALRHGGVGEFLRIVEEARNRGERIGDAPLHGEHDDVVTITSIHSAKGLEWPVVFWADTVRQLGGHTGDPLCGRDRIVLKDPTAKSGKDQPERWQQLKQTIDNEEHAEDRRLWYVAMTRAKERLIVSGLPAGQRDKPKRSTPAGWLWQVMPACEIADGANFWYPGANDRRHLGVVRVADPGVLQPEEGAAPAEPGPVSDLATVPAFEPRIPVPAGGRRHSASEMLGFARCARRHWFKYVLGLREPAVDTASTGFIDAVTRGTIVHDVLERLREEDELDSLLEDAIGRWDEEAPPPESGEGVRYRTHLREEIESVSTHADYRTIADLPSARRELGFLHIADAEHCYQGKIDLAAVEDERYVLLDVKTSQGDAEASERKAADYALQRDVYVASAEGISGREVGRFAFQFSRAGVQVSEQVTDDVRTRIRESLTSTLAAMGGDAPALTKHAWECQWCGYKQVGWCEGV
jgi:ATP-dependent helicase/nuclease subunit A